jgi:hypothetical protein
MPIDRVAPAHAEAAEKRDVNRRSASASRSATTTLAATITYRRESTWESSGKWETDRVSTG